MIILYTRCRFDNYKKAEFYIAKKNMKKIVKLCLQLGYIVQNRFHFDKKIFMEQNFQF